MYELLCVPCENCADLKSNIIPKDNRKTKIHNRLVSTCILKIFENLIKKVR